MAGTLVFPVIFLSGYLGGETMSATFWVANCEILGGFGGKPPTQDVVYWVLNDRTLTLFFIGCCCFFRGCYLGWEMMSLDAGCWV